MEAILLAIAGVLLGGAGGAVLGSMRALRRGTRPQTDSGSDRTAPADPSARVAATAQRAEQLVVAAREQAVARRTAALEEFEERRAAAEAVESRLARASADVSERRQQMGEKRRTLRERREALETEQAEVDAEREAIEARLLEAAQITRQEAAAAVLERVETELAADHAGRVTRTVDALTGEVTPEARGRIVEGIQRQMASHADTAPRISAVTLEGLTEEERERLLSALSVVAGSTSTDLGVDQERNQASLRGLDPVGREVARQASLEVVERHLSAAEVPPLLLRTRQGLGHRLGELGERALWEMGLSGRPELAELLGVLHHRFSYGQNALLHCQETGSLCATLAAELNMNQQEARAAGLLHDIGKAVDHDVEGSHAIIGGELLTVLGTDGAVVHAVKAHHFDEEPSTDLAMLTICADAISASRPGARRDTLTTYLQRLEQLQSIATRHRGVERAFPMQAGREVRISVRPEQLKDAALPALCYDIAREIETEMTYPGMIKVTVIRETVATATAS